MTSCIFCQIIEGKAEASRVYEDKICLAFMDIQPVNPGHVLVIPKSISGTFPICLLILVSTCFRLRKEFP